MIQENNSRLIHIRVLTYFYIGALILSGITAFPLHWETRLLCQWFGAGTFLGERFPGLVHWLAYVHDGVAQNAVHYPFMTYGTDWLAFAHIIIAVFFVGVAIDPVRNIWIVKTGIIACVLVPVLAFVCGPVRGIPVFWRLIDSCFGVVGVIPLFLICRWTRTIERELQSDAMGGGQGTSCLTQRPPEEKGGAATDS